MQQSAGFPEIEADNFLDWNSQASDEAHADKAPSALDSTSDLASSSRLSQQNCSQSQPCPGSLIWESAGLVPRLKLPVIVNRDPASVVKPAMPSLPPDMPSGPSIATARVKHPLSSTESAALTQLRAELNSLFAEADRGPDLSLVPLPKQLNQATAAKVPVGNKAVRVARLNRLQPRAAAAGFRRDQRRRYTADAAMPNRSHSRHSNSAESAQSTQQGSSQTTLHSQGMTHPAVTQQAVSQQAERAAADVATSLHATLGTSTAGALQPASKSKKYGRSNSWAAGSSPTRTGVTQNGPTSTSYSKCDLLPIVTCVCITRTLAT